MIQVEQCPQCTAPAPPYAERCNYCGSYFRIRHLAQLDKANDDALHFYIKEYRNAVAADSEDGQAYLSLGLCFLRLGLHKEALENFQRACNLIPDNPDLYYYTSIAMLGGRRPRLASLMDIKAIEKYLEAGLKIRPKDAAILFLRGAIKEDYYKANGLRESPRSDHFYKKAKMSGLTEEQRTAILKQIGLAPEQIVTPEEKARRRKIEREKRLRIRLYFLPRYFWFIAGTVALLGALIAAFGGKYQIPTSSASILSAMAVTIMLYLAYKRANTKLIDKYFIEDLEMLKTKRAIDKLGIEPQKLARESAIAYGPVIEGKGRMFVQDRKDKKNRYRKIRVIVAAFGEHQLLTYQCVFDFTTGKSANETTDEFFYNDVVSASTGIGFWEYRLNGKVISDKEVELFKLTTSAGTDISIPIRSKHIGSSGDKAIALAGDTVQAIRCMLREKKENRNLQNSERPDLRVPN